MTEDKRSEEAVERNREMAKARTKAMIRLTKLHPEDFCRIRDEIRESMGFPPAEPRSRKGSD